MIDAPFEVPNQVRQLTVIGIDNVEKALALFFDNVAKSIAPSSAGRADQAGHRGQDGLRAKDCARQ
jgi:hypothetical protein